MAFRDESGRITIDEAAAAGDVANLGTVEESLREACGHLRRTASQAGDFSGGTGAAIVDVAGELAAQAQSAADKARQAAELITATVQKYQAIDQSLKAAAESL